MGVIPTFAFYAVLYSAMKRLLTMARMPEWVILSFIYRLSFKQYYYQNLTGFFGQISDL